MNLGQNQTRIWAANAARGVPLRELANQGADAPRNRFGRYDLR